MSQLQLEGEVEQKIDEVYGLQERIDSLESRVDDLQGDLVNAKRDAVVMLLSLLTESLRHVASGKMEMPTVTAVSGDGQDARWTAIKSRLAPRLKEAVEILLLQGPMGRKQIAAALRMDYSNCTKNVIGILLRQGIAIIQDGQIALKKL